MAENSPMKQQRSYHPYRPIKSPLKPSQLHTATPVSSEAENLSKLLSSKMTENFFSFSGGSPSLFPTSRSAMTEVSNVVSKTAKKSPLKQALNTAHKGDKNVAKSSEPLGAIGQHRLLRTHLSQPLKSTPGFIPIKNSFIIFGDAEESKNENQAQNEEKDKAKVIEVEEEKEKVLPLPPPPVIVGEEKKYIELKSVEINIDTVEEFAKVDLDKSNLENKPISEEERERGEPVRKNLFPKDENNDENENSMEIETPHSTAVVPFGVLSERKEGVYDLTQYGEYIYNYWLSQEANNIIKPRFMEKQQFITHQMRTVLIDWLVEVGIEYALENETLFMAINYIDRFLCKMGVTKNNFQLLGITAVFIAAKLEEVDAPTVDHIVHITDKTYPKDEVFFMEKLILKVIDFELMLPTASHFAKALCSLLQLESLTVSCVQYLVELSLLETKYLRYRGSVIATAAVAIARHAYEKIYWDDKIEGISKLRVYQIQRCSAHLLNSFYSASSCEHTAIYNKYKSVRFSCISLTSLPATLPPFII